MAPYHIQLLKIYVNRMKQEHFTCCQWRNHISDLEETDQIILKQLIPSKPFLTMIQNFFFFFYTMTMSST